ncbi:MAG: radical SAM protein, partial [Cyclobacteriaceae bacterium]
MPLNRDTLNLISKLTIARIWNGLLLLYGYWFSRITRSPRQFGMPASIAIEPTTSCNLRCPECPSGLRSFSRPTGMLQRELFERIIEDLQRQLFYLTFYFQGEPYLHPDFLQLVRFAASRKIYTATSTNAHFLTN